MFSLLQPIARLRLLSLRALPLLFLGSMASLGNAQTDEYDTWLDESGQFKIEAKFMGLSNGNVNLQTRDGKTKAVPYAKLSLSSQFKAKKLADPKAFDAPPLPSSFAPPPLPEDPFPADASIEQYLDTLNSHVREGKAEVVWYSLPPKMRGELSSLIAKSAEVVGPTTFRQLQAVLPNVLVIVRDKRAFIVGHPLVAAKPEVAKALNQALPALEPIVELMTQKSTWSSENFKEANVGPWMMLFAKDMMAAYNKAQPALQSAFGKDAFPSIQEESYKVLEKTADTAKIEVAAGKKKQVKVYKKIDGYWQPAEFEKAYEQFAQARSQLDSLDQSQIDTARLQARTGLTFLNGILGTLAKAKTQQEFNQALEPILSQIPKGMPGTPGMAGMSSGMPGAMPTGSGEMPPNYRRGKDPASLGAGLAP